MNLTAAETTASNKRPATAAAAAAAASPSTSSTTAGWSNNQNNNANYNKNNIMMNNLTNSFSQQLRIVMDNPPPENPRVEDIEKMAASEMNQLSMESREQILYDLHGISEMTIREIDETPEFIRDRLQKLRLSIDEDIPSADKVAYDVAVTRDPQYVHNPTFQLQFLRSDFFDPCRAAVRYTKHFQAKLELFGEELLCKDITQDDLDTVHHGAIKCLYSGWIQELPTRDVSGRLVSVLFNKAMDPALSPEDKLRAIWYRRMVNATEMETQRNGIVFIIYDSELTWDREAIWKVGRLLSCLPVRFMAYHMCFQPERYEQMGPMIALGRMAVETYDRHRYRVHTGSPLELKYALQTFGIPVSALPIDDDGIVSTEYNTEFWEKQRLEERRTMTEGNFDHVPSVRITTPGKHDVLMGRGRSCQEHPGNVRFRFLIEQNLERYDTTPKHKKMLIALEILDEIHQRGGKVLTPSDTGWIEIDEATAREKVSSCFRSIRKVKGPGNITTKKTTGTVRKVDSS